MIKKILARLLHCDLAVLNNVLIHIPAGIFTVYAWHKAQSLALLFGVGFLVYEAVEWRVIQDKSYPDLQGWLYGICFGIVGWEIIKFIW